MKKLIAISMSLILALVLVCAASAETVQAKPVEIDPSNLEGRRRMVRTDIEYKEGDKMQLTLYVPERFDAAAIQAVQPGDVIVTDGEEIKIETVDTDGPDFVFNKCTENEMLFCDAGHDEFEHCMDNDYVPWIATGILSDYRLCRPHLRRHPGRSGYLPRRSAHGTAEEPGRRLVLREERGRGL